METNNNKQREALEALVEVVEAWKDHLPPAIRDGELSKALKKANSALSAPRRNCDVGTAEEQEKRFYAFCLGNGRRNGGVCDKTCPCYACECLCTFTWAQMPYKDGGAE